MMDASPTFTAALKSPSYLFFSVIIAAKQQQQKKETQSKVHISAQLCLNGVGE